MIFFKYKCASNAHDTLLSLVSAIIADYQVSTELL